MTQPQLAEIVAEIAHAGQHYGESDYIGHLRLVVGILQSAGVNDDVTLTAGWLHDCLEDTKVSMRVLQRMFGEEVADIVFRVTDSVGRNRRERWQQTSPKIFGHTKATSVKLADRICHFQTGLYGTGSKLDMYIKEHLAFKGALYDDTMVQHSTPIKRLWEELDDLYAQATN